MTTQSRFQFHLSDMLLAVFAAGIMGAYLWQFTDNGNVLVSIAVSCIILSLLVSIAITAAANLHDTPPVRRGLKIAGLCIMLAIIGAAGSAYMNSKRALYDHSNYEALAVCKSILAAQRYYHEQDQDNDGVLEYTANLPDLQKVGLIPAVTRAEYGATKPGSLEGFMFLILTQSTNASYMSPQGLTKGHAVAAIPTAAHSAVFPYVLCINDQSQIAYWPYTSKEAQRIIRERIFIPQE